MKNSYWLIIKAIIKRLTENQKALQEIWDATDEFSRKSTDVFIYHLRKYLAKDARVQIANVHGK